MALACFVAFVVARCSRAPSCVAFVSWSSLFAMDRALLSGDSSAPTLASGVATKLSDAAAANGDVVIPTSTGSLVGRQFRQLAQLAALSETEAMALLGWIEEAYSLEAAQRFLEPLPSLTLTVPLTSSAAPTPAAAPTPLVGPTALVGSGASGSFASLVAGASSSPTAAPHATVHTSTAGMMPHQTEDELAHGMDAGKIATLTFLLHTARLPPPGHESVKYGVDPSSMTKLYRGMQSSVGSLLWDLVGRASSTIKDFQDHFHRATQAAGDPAISQRLSGHWMELAQYFDSVEMIRAYYKKFLTIKSGRGLPQLVDEHIVTLVICAEFERSRGCDQGNAKAELTAIAERAGKAAETVRDAVSEIKAKVGELKSEVNNLKAEVKEMKGKAGQARECSYCGKTGHTEKFCHKRIADEQHANQS